MTVAELVALLQRQDQSKQLAVLVHDDNLGEDLVCPVVSVSADTANGMSYGRMDKPTFDGLFLNYAYPE